jgi:hypothetical protein
MYNAHHDVRTPLNFLVYDRELRHVHSSIVDSIAPYSRFVRVERAKAETSVTTIQAAIQQLQRLKAEVAGA